MDKWIADLEARVAKYETELDAAASAQEKSEIRQIFKSNTLSTDCWTRKAQSGGNAQNTGLMSNGITLQQPAVRHISRNLGLYGFGTEKSAIIQSLKELLENSIDACLIARSSATHAAKTINLSIKSASHTNESIVLEVSDEGCGIADPQTVLKCFSTSKDDGIAKSSGRFGIGLSTCFIYSFLTTNSPTRIVTKCSIDQAATVADFSLDNIGSPVCIQQKSLSANLSSGTKISITVPLATINSAEILCDVWNTLVLLIKRLCVHPAHSLAIDTTTFQRSIHQVATDPFIVAAALSSEHVLCSQFTRNLNFMLSEDSIHCSCGEAELLGMKVSSIVTLTETAPSMSKSNSDEFLSAQSDSICLREGILPIHLWRYVNHVPLLDQGDDALSCCTASALRSLRWPDYGYKLSTAHVATDSTNKLHTFRWEAKAMRPETIARLQAEKLSLVVVVDVISSNIPYANMRKSSLQSDHPHLSRLIGEAIRFALNNLEGGTEKCGLFASQKEYKRGLVLSKYIPSIARSITRIIKHSKSAQYIQLAHETVDLPCDLSSASAAAMVEPEDTGSAGADLLFDQDAMRVRLTALLEDIAA